MADLYAQQTSWLLKGASIDGYPTLFDVSIRQKQVYLIGSRTFLSTPPYGGENSLGFGGGSFVVSPYSDDFDISSGDWTLECWFKARVLGAHNLVSINTDSSAYAQARIAANAAGNFHGLVENSVGGSWVTGSAAGSYTPGTWVHLAFVRSGNTVTLYVNGVSVLTYTVSTVFNRRGVCTVGTTLMPGQEQYLDGEVYDVRFVKGVAVYSGNFTPPSAPIEGASPPPALPSPPRLYLVRTRLGKMDGTTYPQNQRKARRIGSKVPFFFYKDNAGNGVISGVVTIENIPGSRKVRLYRKQDGMLIRETWSAANGAYSFTNIDPAWEYFVVAHDHLRVYNGVIQDMLVP